MPASIRTTAVALLPLLVVLQGAPALQLVTELARIREAVPSTIPVDQRAGVAARLDRAAAALDAGRALPRSICSSPATR